METRSLPLAVLMRIADRGFEEAFSRSSAVDWSPFPAISFSLVIFSSPQLLIRTSRYYSTLTIPKIRNPQSEGSGQRQRQQGGGIDVNPLPPNSDVQVRRRGSAGSAAQPNDLTLLHAVAFAHFDFGQVHIKRQ